MAGDIIPIQMTDMLDFPEEQIAKAGELLGCQMDRASCIRALIIQQDTGLSMARGEISIVPFKGKPQVFINRQGYLAYANRQSEYDGFESGTEEVNGRLTAWCKVYRKDRRFPASVRILFKEFGKTSPVWQQMPEYMLEKTAISLALRQAFPVLNGTLTEEEIDAPYTIARRPDDIDVTPTPAPERIAKPEEKQQAPQQSAPKQEPAPQEQPAAEKPAQNSIPNKDTNGFKDTKETKNIQQETKPPKCLYTQQQVQNIIQNMQAQGLAVPTPAWFESTRTPDGVMYNGDIINEEYTRLINLKKEQAKSAEKPTPAPEPAPAKAEVKTEAKENPKKEPETPKQTKPTKEEPPKTVKKEPQQKQSTCPVCGKPSMTADEAKQLECLADTKIFEHTLCRDCATKWWNDYQEKQRQLEEKMPKCTDCGRRITEDEARRSLAKFGEPVCPECWIRRYNKKE